MPENIANQKESLKLCAYNCLNYKSNTVGVLNIITNHDITYISEHWLDIREEYLLNEYKKDYFVFFSAVYDNTINTKGRPSGGTCWFINKKIDLIKYEMLDNFNERISRIRIKDNQSDYIDIFGIFNKSFFISLSFLILVCLKLQMDFCGLITIKLNFSITVFSVEIYIF